MCLSLTHSLCHLCSLVIFSVSCFILFFPSFSFSFFLLNAILISGSKNFFLWFYSFFFSCFYCNSFSSLYTFILHILHLWPPHRFTLIFNHSGYLISFSGQQRNKQKTKTNLKQTLTAKCCFSWQKLNFAPLSQKQIIQVGDYTWI